MIIAGPSGSGKTTFVERLIENDTIFNEKPQRIIWCYGATPPSDKIGNFNILSKEGLLAEDEISTLDLIILDDLMEEGNASKLFTKLAHHRHCFVIYITQNLYSKNSRTSNLNTHYLVLFKNPRDQSQIQVLARQMFPSNTKFLIEAYKDATSDPFNCLFIDLRQTTPDRIRVRSNPFIKPIRVYISK